MIPGKDQPRQARKDPEDTTGKRRGKPRGDRPIGEDRTFDELVTMLSTRFELGEGATTIRVLSQFNRRADPDFPYAMGVSLVDNVVHLVWNPKILGQMTPRDVQFVLIHEALHIVNQHIPRHYIQKRSYPDHVRFDACSQIAADLATNSALRKLGYLRPKQKGIGPDEEYEILLPELFDFDDGLVYETYLERLLSRDQQLPTTRLCEIAGRASPMVVSGPESLDLPEVEKVKDQLEQAIERSKVLHGNGPAGVEERVVASSRPSRLSWRDLLRRGVTSALVVTSPSLRVPKIRRWADFYRYRVLPFPGLEVRPNPKVALCIDTSGSIDTNQLQAVLSELLSLTHRRDLPAELWCIECDARVQAVYQIKKGTTALSGFTRDHTFRGRGGTAFQPAIEEAMRLRVAVIIYFSDCEGPIPKAPGVPIYWVIPGVPRTSEWRRMPGRVLQMQL